MESILSERYSGPKSEKFWKRIDAIKKEPEHMLLYIAACALQDHESRVFQMIEEISAAAARRGLGKTK
jgi:hypothetical protein